MSSLDLAPLNPNMVLAFTNVPYDCAVEDLNTILLPYVSCGLPKIFLQRARSLAFVIFDSEIDILRCREGMVMGIVVKGSLVRVRSCNGLGLSVPGRVLLVNVVNMLYPVSVDAFYTVFSRFGKIENVSIVGDLGYSMQALLEFSTVDEAASALVFDGECMYSGANQLEISFSNSLVDSAAVVVEEKTDLLEKVDFEHDTLKKIQALLESVSEDQDSFSSDTTVSDRGSIPELLSELFFGTNLFVDDSKNNTTTPSAVYADYESTMNAATIQVESIDNPNVVQMTDIPGPILAVSNLPPEVTVDSLFNLFSFYGHVTKIKLLDPPGASIGSGLVQFQETTFSALAAQFLQGSFIMGHCMQIQYAALDDLVLPSGPVQHFSQKLDSAMNRKLADMNSVFDVSRYRSFSMRERRFGSTITEKVIRSACKPTHTLHLANVSGDATEQDVIDTLEGFGSVRGFKWLTAPSIGADGKKTTRMALAQMSSAEEGLAALMFRHNSPVRDRLIKISFSKAHL